MSAPKNPGDPTNPIPPGAAPTVDHAEPADTEVVYYQGSPPVTAALGNLSIYLLIGLVLIAIPILYAVFSNGHEWLVWWLTAGFFIVGLALPLIPVLMAKTVRYRITNYRIDYERGLFSKDIDTLELWHVDDIHLHQSLVDRILGLGIITIESHDETMPKLVLHGLPKPMQLYESLKQRVIAVKRQRGVIKVDPG
jgi:membrane protein YdbS with pleckstrin-like domain